MKRGKEYVQRAKLTLSKAINPQQARRMEILALIVVVGCSIGFAVRAYTRTLKRNATAISSPATTPNLMPQSHRSLDYTRLARQPDVDRMRRQLGRRFLSGGREVAVLTGTLSLDRDAHPLRIVRSQEQAGELVSLAIENEPALEWRDNTGAMNGGRAAPAEQRKLIERIALDSPDQFILAQLRGASYRMVAQNVAPKGAADLEDYNGPAWDVIRIAEPEAADDKRPLSRWRLFYVNTVSGLIERIVSHEEGETVEAELSGWIDADGEKLPLRIVWKRNGKEVMVLNLTAASHHPKQE
jgi:hypothetical protein